MKLAAFVIASVAALVLSAAPANAAHIQCGDTITTSDVLDSDVVCPDTHTDAGLYIGGEGGITLRLDGYAIRAGANGGTVGIQTAFPLSGIRIRGGRIEGFDEGVSLQAVDSTVARTTITAKTGGISLGGAFDAARTAPCEPRYRGANCVFRNDVEITEGGAESFGIRVVSGTGEAHVWGNSVRGVAQAGIKTSSDRPRVVLNDVQSCLPASDTNPEGVGISVAETTFSVIARNTVGPCSNATGIVAGASLPEQGGHQVRRNRVTGNGTGIWVDDTGGGRVWCNEASDNIGTGILVGFLAGNTVVSENTASRNGAYGIFLSAGTEPVDGGGNVGADNPLGCANVVCGPPPSTCSVSVGAG